MTDTTSTTATHTPGPWHTHPNDPWEVYAGQSHLGFNMPASEKTVCDIRHVGSQISEANARLIAAAPELLALAKEFIRYQVDEAYRDEKDAEAERATDGNVSYLEALEMQFEDAVAKAEGREP